MNIFGLLNQERTCARMDAGSKKRSIEQLSEILAAQVPTHSKEQVFESLVARERLGSTGLGQGVAIPHCRLQGLEQPLAAFATLASPVDYDSPDGKAVDILFCLIVPDDDNEGHLKLLAEIAELFSNETLCKQLREINDSPELLNALHHWQQQHAAA